MPIPTTCPHCRQALRVADEQVGRRVRCPACRTAFAVGVDRAAPAAAPVTDPRALARARTALPGLGLAVNGLLTALTYAALLAFVAAAAAGQFVRLPRPVAVWNERHERPRWPAVVRVEFEDGFTYSVFAQLLLL